LDQGAGGSCDYPAVGDVESGVAYSFGTLTGTLVVPAVGNVLLGTGYGAGGTEFTGTLASYPRVSGGTYMLARLRDIVNSLRDHSIGIHRVTFYPRTAGDTYGAGAEFWATRDQQRRAMEDGRIVVRATWHLYRTDDPLQATIPTPMGKVVDEAGVTWHVGSEGSVVRGYRDPGIASEPKELKFDLETVAAVS
jgi:hypothetical protein